uniref:Uncharacterized protein n=1 Tax=viral metagenome TaxID=1070528 RepID=A0A2V0R930_9ZZZZ
MEVVAFISGRLMAHKDWDINTDSDSWNSAISAFEGLPDFMPYKRGLEELRKNICFYFSLSSIDSSEVGINEYFRCPCGAHRELEVVLSPELKCYHRMIMMCISSVIREAITVSRVSAGNDEARCAYCNELISMRVLVSKNVSEIRDHIATQLDVDDGVRLCYCDKNNVCKCYLEQSLGFGSCVPMIYASQGYHARHSSWCNKCEFPRFCTNPVSLNEEIAESLISAENKGTLDVPFTHEADVMPLGMCVVNSRLISDFLAYSSKRKTIYFQAGCGCLLDGACRCNTDDFIVDSMFVDRCVTPSMAMSMRSALKERDITFITDCTMCGKTQLCPETSMNTFTAYDETCVDTSDNIVHLQPTNRVISEYLGLTRLFP